MSEVIEAIQLWRRGGEEANIELVTRALSEDVQLISPITDQFRFVGIRQIRLLLEVALGAVQEIRYTDEISDGNTVALFYEGVIGNVPIAEAQRLRINGDGLITEITMFIRPLPALTKLALELGPKLARANGQPVFARTVKLAGSVLHGMAASGERSILPKAAPK